MRHMNFVSGGPNGGGLGGGQKAYVENFSRPLGAQSSLKVSADITPGVGKRSWRNFSSQSRNMLLGVGLRGTGSLRSKRRLPEHISGEIVQWTESCGNGAQRHTSIILPYSFTWFWIRPTFLLLSPFLLSSGCQLTSFALST